MLPLEGEALYVLWGRLPHKQSDWAETGRRMLREDVCEEHASWQPCDREKLGAFAANLWRLLRQGYPDFATDALEELALQAFLRGL